jgi:hypothetical protein
VTIGIKSLIAVLLAVAALAIGVAKHVFDAERFVHLSAGSAFAIGLFASACAALVGFGWRPRTRSRTAIAVRAGVPAIVEDAPGARELPAVAQRVLLVVVFATLALGTLGNEATARIGSVPADLTKPSRSEYCPPDEPEAAEPEPAPVVEQQQVDQAGCALVKRAYALGYAKSLGSCAPKTITLAPAPKTAAKPVEVCTRRLLDEPFLHYAYRKVVDTSSDAAPIDALSARIRGVRARLDYIGDLVADIRHAVTGTPHATHHLWVDMPDPHPSSFMDRFTGTPPCSSRFADLPLWPAWDASTPPSHVLEHVVGQLLFATRFGTPASCSDYTIHWGAAPDACARLAADPAAFLSDAGALSPLRAVLDRRRRQIAMRALAAQLGEVATLPEPPPARAVTSVACLMFDGAKPAVTKTIAIDGESIVMRELHVPAIRPAGGGRLAMYQAVAQVLSGSRYAGASAGTKVDGAIAVDEPEVPVPVPAPPTSPARELPAFEDVPELPLLALELLVDEDPFLRGANLLDRADLVSVYPIEQHLHAFVDAFRRVYFPQRGRL